MMVHHEGVLADSGHASLARGRQAEEKPDPGPKPPDRAPLRAGARLVFAFHPRFFRGPLAIVRVLPALFCAAGALPFPVVVHAVVNEPSRLAPRHRRGSCELPIKRVIERKKILRTKFLEGSP